MDLFVVFGRSDVESLSDARSPWSAPDGDCWMGLREVVFGFFRLWGKWEDCCAVSGVGEYLKIYWGRG